MPLGARLGVLPCIDDTLSSPYVMSQRSFGQTSVEIKLVAASLVLHGTDVPADTHVHVCAPPGEKGVWGGLLPTAFAE